MLENEQQLRYIVPTGLLNMCAKQMRTDEVALSPLAEGFAEIYSMQDVPPRLKKADVVCVQTSQGGWRYFEVVPRKTILGQKYNRKSISFLDLPPETHRRLKNSSIHTITQLTRYSATRLKTISMCTPVDILRVTTALSLLGLTLSKYTQKRRRRS
jgi:hypothetical protein